MNKKERRQTELKRHYEFLERFSEFLGKKQDGKKLSLKLLKLEKEANKAATDYCNGENGMTSETWEAFSDKMAERVEEVFGGMVIIGLQINGDARGYALKIDDDIVRNVYPESIGFYKDWGGYGILSPVIE